VMAGRLGSTPIPRSANCAPDSDMDANPDVLIFYAYRYSEEMGKAVEAVVKGSPSREQVEHLYKLLRRDGGKHLSQDVYMALIEAVRRASDH
jgi:hypothetical protein